MLLVMGILVFTTVLSLSSFIRIDVVAVLVLLVLGVTQLLPPAQLFSGFSSEAVIALIATMVISAGLEKAGMAVKLSRWILRIGHEHPKEISRVLMIVSGLMAGFIRSLNTVALLLPVVSRISLRAGIQKSSLLMPIGFCAVLGSSLTMIGSGPLIILNGLLQNQDLPVPLAPFHIFSVFPIGFIQLTVGVLFFIFIGYRLLPRIEEKNFQGTTKQHFLRIYGKATEIFELKILPESDLVGQTLSTIETLIDDSSSILAVRQGKETYFPPLRNMILNQNALIAMMGHKEIIMQFAASHGFKVYQKLNFFSELLHPVRSGLCEAVIPPSSQLIGKDLGDLHMRRMHQVHVLALYRDNVVYRGEALRKLVLHSGDTLGMFCRWESLDQFHKNPDFAVLTTAYPKEELRPHKIYYATFSFLASMLLIFFGMPISVGLLLGAVCMVGFRVITVDEAYESVSWSTVFLVAGLIPLGLVMKETHTVAWLTQHMGIFREGIPIIVIQTTLALLTMGFALVISNVGATVVLVPVAVDIALKVGADPRIFALTVALAASNTFLFPTNQVNALIAGPGGYQLKDFLRVGGILSVLYLLSVTVLLNYLF
jgi:di/tricarboxylate transporter